MKQSVDFQSLRLPEELGLESHGRVLAVRAGMIEARMPKASLGARCSIKFDEREIHAEIISFSDTKALLAPLDHIQGIHPGAKIVQAPKDALIPVSKKMLGRVLDCLGKPVDHQPIQNSVGHFADLDACPTKALNRAAINKVFKTGVRSIDMLCTLGVGQRVGIFAPAGSGKSTLLGMLAKNSNADVNVIALIGERGREVQDFIEQILGDEVLKKSVVVVATSDESALRRATAAKTASAIAEFFRAEGKHVCLLVDSLTRVARALRDMSLASGELPVRQGFTPTVFSQLPILLERSGTNQHGAISAFYTVLSSTEQSFDSLDEELKSLLDGHLVLSSKLAEQGIRPALDTSKSLSRLSHTLQDENHHQDSILVRRAISRIQEDRDLVLLGGEADRELKHFLENENLIQSFLSQPLHQRESFDASMAQLKALASQLRNTPQIKTTANNPDTNLRC